MQTTMRAGSRLQSVQQHSTGSSRLSIVKLNARSVAAKAYLEPSTVFAVTQQGVAFAAALGVDAYLERNRKSPPDLKIVGAGAAGTLAASAILNSGVDALVSVGLIFGVLATGAMTVYHIKRTAEADDPDIDWPGPKAAPALAALISFFALSAFVQGLRAEL